MDFGMVSYDGLSKADFILPPGKQTVLSGNKFSNPQLYIGFPKWGRKEWIGKIYPAGIKDAQFLDEYVKHYNCIELNATHYKIYSPAEITKWATKVKGTDFKFCPKITNRISHYSGFNNVDALTTSFLEGVTAFGENLGVIFLQVSEKFSPNQKDKLIKYLEALPTDLKFFLEVRHRDWFQNPPVKQELFHKLAALNIGLIITDTPGQRDLMHLQLTAPIAFIRFVCMGDKELDYFRVKQWKQILKSWFEQGLQECYFFLHVHNEKIDIEFSNFVKDELQIIVASFNRGQ